MSTSLIFDNKFLNHETMDGPESPERYEEILSVLQNDKSLWETLSLITPCSATEKDILRCHTPTLFNQIKDFCHKDEAGRYLDNDTFVGPETFEIASLSAGAAITAVNEVLTKKASTAFSLARPPGHHATSNQAMGFCFFNNAAIAARYAQAEFGVENILIIDWDVHHGNGTQEIFYNDPSVFYFSIHEFPFYPGTGPFTEIGEGAGKGKNLNLPVPARISSLKYRQTFTAGLNTIKKIFTPDMIIISAGFDARLSDPIGQLRLLEDDFYSMTNEVLDVADQFCGNRVVSILEGGYVSSDGSLGASVQQHVAALSGM